MSKKDYSKGKIYKIEPLNNDEGEIYIGCTTKDRLSQRMAYHRNGYKRWLDSKDNSRFVTSFQLFDKYGLDNCSIYLLEAVSAKSYDELLAREGHYIKTLKCVNKNIPSRTPQEWRIDNKELLKEKFNNYYNKNFDKISKQKKEYKALNEEKYKKYSKQYYNDNKETFLEKRKEYCENNSDKIKETKQHYYNSIKNQLSEKVVCECGATCSKSSLVRHYKSEKHLFNIKKVKNNI